MKNGFLCFQYLWLLYYEFYQALLPRFVGMGYSEDLRKKAIEYLKQGNSQRETSGVFGVSLATINKWNQKHQKTGSVTNKPLERTFKKTDPDKLKAYIKKYPDAHLKGIGEEFGCSGMAVHYAFKRLEITRKKDKAISAKLELFRYKNLFI